MVREESVSPTSLMVVVVNASVVERYRQAHDSAKVVDAEKG